MPSRHNGALITQNQQAEKIQKFVGGDFAYWKRGVGPENTPEILAGSGNPQKIWGRYLCSSSL
jgi:hypothetical protein